MSVVLSLIAALAYGVSDFLGGLASRGAPARLVLTLSYPFGIVLMVVLLPVVGGQLDPATVAWGCVGGMAGATGVVLLYAGLATGPMGVVAPLTAVSSAVVSVGVGVGLGERPSTLAYFGGLLALGAVVLVSRGPGRDGASSPVTVRAVLLALLAGAGFGSYFCALHETPSTSGMWPLVISRAAGAVLIVGSAARHRALPIRSMDGAAVRLAFAAGALDAAAHLAYLLAVRHGLLALVSVLVALYPAATVGLATVVLGERTGRAQRLGLVIAAGSVALIARTG